MIDFIVQGVLIGVGIVLTFLGMGIIATIALFFIGREISDANDI
jgi:Na+-transporting methylmalonyl-CoA/oxaloacetate decarboxylase gamma subunit